MTTILTAAQMRDHENAAMESGRVSGLVLMERAGTGVVKAILEDWPQLAMSGSGSAQPEAPKYLLQTGHPRRAVVFCGPGNNGGDGFVVARLLRSRGWHVIAYLLGDPTRLPPDAKVNHDRWRESGIVQVWDPAAIAAETADLFVDAVFGSGIKRAPGPDVLDPLVALRVDGRSVGRMVAVDAPTGLCMDSGRTLSSDGHGVDADLTVTFHRARPGHFLAEGPRRCGWLVTVDIGLEDQAGHFAAELVDGPMADLSKNPGAHKYTHGHALILAGGAGRTGAARLAARAALRVGAGLVTLGVPPAAQSEAAAQLTAIMLERIPDTVSLDRVLADGRCNTVCLGPGFGFGKREVELVAAVLATGRSCVLDADALTLIGRDAGLASALHPGCVLTPHDGEFTRLCPDLADRMRGVPDRGPGFSRLDAARAAAERFGAVVLLKGSTTAIANGDGQAALHAAVYDRGAPWLATAGSGDVLAGLVAGLLARGWTPCDAARSASWLHAETAIEFGPGLIAEDLPEILPAVLTRALCQQIG